MHILFYILAGIVFAYWLFGIIQPRYNRPMIFWKPIGVFSVLIVAVLFAWVGYLTGGPKNFEECVAANIKTTSSELAATAIGRACRILFPEKKYESYEQCVEKKKHEKSIDEACRFAVVNLCSKRFPPNEYYAEYSACIIKNSPIESTINPELDCRGYFPTDETKKYYKCILKNMKGVSTDIAAQAVIVSCKERYGIR